MTQTCFSSPLGFLVAIPLHPNSIFQGPVQVFLLQKSLPEAILKLVNQTQGYMEEEEDAGEANWRIFNKDFFIFIMIKLKNKMSDKNMR